jgi:methionyl-tRNA formyltransferase
MRTIVIATPHARNDDLVLAVAQHLPEYRVARIRRREELTLAHMRALSPDWIFFPHWSWLIPEDVFVAFRCVIFHMTDLPYGRGGSPLQNLIVRGHRETRLSALRCVRELDAGPVYLKCALSLGGSAEEILRRASALIGEMVLEIVRTEPHPVEQRGEVVTFRRRTAAQSDLAAVDSVDAAYDHIRMLDADSYPHAFIACNGLVYEFRQAEHHGTWIEARVRISKREQH